MNKQVMITLCQLMALFNKLFNFNDFIQATKLFRMYQAPECVSATAGVVAKESPEKCHSLLLRPNMGSLAYSNRWATPVST